MIMIKVKQVVVIKKTVKQVMIVIIKEGIRGDSYNDKEYIIDYSYNKEYKAIIIIIKNNITIVMIK